MKEIIFERIMQTIYCFVHLFISSMFCFWLLGFISEFKRFVGIWRKCGRWYDDHFPDITDRSFWQPNDVWSKGKRWQNSNYKWKQEGNKLFISSSLLCLFVNNFKACIILAFDEVLIWFKTRTKASLSNPH